MKFTRSLIALFLLAVSCVAAAQTASSYPTKTIRILVSFTPGGPTDLLARGLARHFSQVWKQSVVVENRPGAGGLIALQVAKTSPPDGYTLVMHSDGFAIAPAIYEKLPYDPEHDFTPIGLVARAANILAVADNSPYADLAALVKAGQGSQISYASAGVGSAQHMQAAKFAMQAGLNKPIHVPFKGTPEALNDVMAGRVDFVFAPMSNIVPLLIPGKLRALAVSTSRRSPLLPNVPTVAELGYPKYVEEQWWGLFAPSAVPADIKQKIEDETRVAMKTPEMLALIAQLSSSPGDLFGKDFAALIDEQIQSNIAAAAAGKIAAQ